MMAGPTVIPMGMKRNDVLAEIYKGNGFREEWNLLSTWLVLNAADLSCYSAQKDTKIKIS